MLPRSAVAIRAPWPAVHLMYARSARAPRAGAAPFSDHGRAAQPSAQVKSQRSKFKRRQKRPRNTSASGWAEDVSRRVLGYTLPDGTGFPDAACETGGREIDERAYTALIRSSRGSPDLAVSFFQDMQKSNVPPSSQTLVALLECLRDQPERGEALFREAAKGAAHVDRAAMHALFSLFRRRRADVRRLYEELVLGEGYAVKARTLKDIIRNATEVDEVLWFVSQMRARGMAVTIDSLNHAFRCCKGVEQVEDVLAVMREIDLQPNGKTVHYVLQKCTSELEANLYYALLTIGTVPDSDALHAMLHWRVKSGKSGQDVVEEMREKSIPLTDKTFWLLFSHCGEYSQMRRYLREMDQAGFAPTAQFYSLLMKRAPNKYRTRPSIVEEMKEKGIELDALCYELLLDSCVPSFSNNPERLEVARRLWEWVKEHTEPDSGMYSTAIEALAGSAEEAHEVYMQAKERGVAVSLKVKELMHSVQRPGTEREEFYRREMMGEGGAIDTDGDSEEEESSDGQ